MSGANGNSLHWHVLPCPFCGAEAVEFEMLAEEVYDKQAWRIKHNKDCWFSNGKWPSEHVITKTNMFHWNFRQNASVSIPGGEPSKVRRDVGCFFCKHWCNLGLEIGMCEKVHETEGQPMTAGGDGVNCKFFAPNDESEGST